MQSHVDCIVHRPVCYLGKLKRIQQGSSDVLQVGQHQFFKWLHDHRCNFGFLWDGEDGGAFEAWRDFAQFQWSVEDLCEDGDQLVSAGFQTGWSDIVCAWCFFSFSASGSPGTPRLRWSELQVWGRGGLLEVLKAGVGCFFKSAIELIQIFCQLLILQSAGDGVL